MLKRKHKASSPQENDQIPGANETTRRELLRFAGWAGTAAILAACAGPSRVTAPRSDEIVSTTDKKTTPPPNSSSTGPNTVPAKATTTSAESTTTSSVSPETTQPPKPEMKKPVELERMTSIRIDALPLNNGEPLVGGVYGGIDEKTINHQDFVNPDTNQHEPVIGFDIRSDVPGIVGDNGGKSVFFAHRNSHDHPMRHIDVLEPGATMELNFKDESGVEQMQTWVMNRPHEVYDQTDPALVDLLGKGDGTPQIVLFACANPDGSYGIDDPNGLYGIKNGSYSPEHRILTFWEQVPPA